MQMAYSKAMNWWRGAEKASARGSGLEGVSKTNDEEILKHNTLSSGLMEHNTKK
jgi:hypothetical protein